MSQTTNLSSHIQANIRAALDEDVGDLDLTAQLIPQHTQAHATIITRQQMVLCGTQWLEGCFRALDTKCNIRWNLSEGEMAETTQTLCEIRGNARAAHGGTRRSEFLQTISATATLTQYYVAAVRGTQTKIWVRARLLSVI